MQHFHKICPERWKIEELKNLTTLSGNYTYYLGQFVICGKFIQRQQKYWIMKYPNINWITYPKNRNLLTRTN